MYAVIVTFLFLLTERAKSLDDEKSISYSRLKRIHNGGPKSHTGVKGLYCIPVCYLISTFIMSLCGLLTKYHPIY